MSHIENPGLRSVFEAARRAVGLRSGCAYADVVSGIKYLKVSSDGRSAAVVRAEKAEAERDNATAALERMRLELVRVDEMVSRYSQSADAVSEDRARWMERYAELEDRVEELAAEADALEAERDELTDLAAGRINDELWEDKRRLEAALREILMTDGLGGASEVMRDIARRALGGGE